MSKISNPSGNLGTTDNSGIKSVSFTKLSGNRGKVVKPFAIMINLVNPVGNCGSSFVKVSFSVRIKSVLSCGNEVIISHDWSILKYVESLSS